MTKISQLSSIGDSLAIGDQFLIRDIDDTGSPNKSVTVSGITRALDLGTANAPAIAFAADKNTGIFSPGTDQLAVATNGTQRLSISSTGHISNTRSIATAFSGTNAATWTNGLTLANAATPGAGVSNLIVFEGTANVNAVFGVIQAGSTYGDFVWAAYNGSFSERMRLTSAGLLGIGSSSPDGALHVVGGGSTTSTIALNGSGGVNDNAVIAATSSLYFQIDSNNNIGSRIFNWRVGGKGFSNGTSLMTLNAAGQLGINTTNPTAKLEVQNGFISVGSSTDTTATNVLIAGYGYIIGSTKYGNASIRSTYDSPSISASLEFYTSNGSTTSTERARIDSSGRLLVGLSTTRTVGTVASYEAPLQIETPNAAICGINLTQNRTDYIGPYLRFGKTGGTTVGSTTVVSNGDELGTIQFCGADGTDLTSVGAQIRAQVDGTPGNDDMPSRLMFSTTPASASSPTERMRIKANGDVSIVTGNLIIGTAGKGIDFSADGQAAGMTSELLDDYEEGTFTPSVEYSTTNTPTYFNRVGRYTKIGQIVHVQIYLNWNESGSVGNLSFTGLPFTVGESYFSRAVLSILSFGLTGPTVSLTGTVSESTTNMQLYLNDNQGTIPSNTNTDNDQDVYVTVTYVAL